MKKDIPWKNILTCSNQLGRSKIQNSSLLFHTSHNDWKGGSYQTLGLTPSVTWSINRQAEYLALRLVQQCSRVSFRIHTTTKKALYWPTSNKAQEYIRFCVHWLQWWQKHLSNFKDWWSRELTKPNKKQTQTPSPPPPTLLPLKHPTPILPLSI